MSNNKDFKVKNGLEVGGDIAVTGTVDGRDLATDGTKLDGVEAGANVTDSTNVVAALSAGDNITISSGGEITATDTNTTYSVGDNGLTQNNFTTTLKDKLDGISASADVNRSISDSVTSTSSTVSASSQAVKTAYDMGNHSHPYASDIDGLSDARSFSSLSSYGLGADALNASMTGGSNTAVGGSALTAITSGYNNTAVGVSALRLNTTGTDSTGLGQQALYDQTTGHGNTAVGKESLSGVTTGQNNIGIGKKSGEYITTGSNNTVLGDLNGTSTMSSTVLLGAGSTERLKIDSTGLYVNGSSTALAGGASDIDGLSDALTTNSGKTIALGSGAGASASASGGSLIAIGKDAGSSYVGSGTNANIALGYEALKNATSSVNVAIGHQSLANLTGLANANTAIGYHSGNLMSSSEGMTILGAYAGRAVTTGDDSTLIGRSAGKGLTTGSKNTFVGKDCGENVTTGSNNTIIGQLVGSTTLANTVLIGAGTTERLKVDSTGLYVNGSTTALAGGALSIDDLSDAISGDASSYGIGDGALPSDDGSTNSNVAIGQNSMASMVSGNSNVALGGYSLQDNVSGTRSTAIGHYALNNSVVTTAAENVAVGYRTGVSSTTGISNTLLGTEAGSALTTGSYNIFVGTSAGTSVSTGSNNTIIGKGGFNTSSSLSSTVLIGAGTTERLKIDSTGLYVNGSSTALAGATELDDLSDAKTLGTGTGQSIGIGTDALDTQTGTNLSNIAIGHSSQKGVSASGEGNISIGKYSLKATTSGGKNISVGKESMEYNTTGWSNTAVGSISLRRNTTGAKNTVVGAAANEHCTTGHSTVAVGYKALQNNTSGDTVSVGTEALVANTTGTHNLATGHNALKKNTTGSNNIGLGYTAGHEITTGSNNTIIGDLDGSSTLSSTVLIGAGTTERLKIDSTGLYVNGSATALGGGGGGGWVPLSTVTTSSGDTSIEITSNIDSTYDSYVMKITGLPTGNSSGPKMHFSTDGGSTYDTSTSMYRYSTYGVDYYNNSFQGPYAKNDNGYFPLSTNNGIESAYVYLYKLADTGKSYYSISGGIGHWGYGFKSIEALGVYGAINTDPDSDTTSPVDALKISTTYSGGFPAGGRVTLYGIANS